ncbi:MAG: GNAT family N-acetyltransferase [Elusimicrobia bacterium]|nr:GNAT family N-acetyltransferase [Elusimicrobiota bacterium]
MTSGIRIVGPRPGSSEVCEAILRALPQWFGIEQAIIDYGREVAELPAFTAFDGKREVGFLSIKEHFPEAAEIHVMGVRPECRGRGVGMALVKEAEDWLRGRGFRLLQVKTLSASRPDPHYAETRAFYKKAGFIPLEEMPKLWSEANPCLISVKSL